MTRPLLALALAVGLSTAAAAQPAKGGPFRAFGLSAADLDAAEPTSANPYTALLRPGAEPDLAYWTAKTQVESRARGQRRALRGLRAAPTARVRERERGRFSGNDTPDTAEPLAGLRAEDEPLVEITGTLEPVPESSASAIETDRDEGETASGAPDPWVLLLREREGDNAALAIAGEIGDGTYGATSGDVDVFTIRVEQPRSYLRLAVETPESDLDPVMALYGPEGYPILVNDDGFLTTDSEGAIFLAQPGAYTLYVWGFADGTAPPGLRNRRDAGSGTGVGSTGAYTVRVEALRPDEDHYAVHLNAGDVLAAATASGTVTDLSVYDPDGTLRMLSRVDYSSLYADDSPLLSPSELGRTGNGITAAIVAPVSGTYAVAARGEGDYALSVQVLPPGPRRAPTGGPEQIFVDFDGGTYSPLADLGEGAAEATLSPLAAFLPRWYLAAEDEDAVIDAILARLQMHLRDALREDVAGMGDFEVELLNSRDHDDPGRESGVARIVIGGSEAEIGIPDIYGQASSVDIGNYRRDDIAYVLLDAYSDPAASPASLNQFGVDSTRSKVDLVAIGVGFTAAHEAGHFFGLHHTDNGNPVPNIMDQGGGDIAFSYDLGRDGVFGPGDGARVRFRHDHFQSYYPFAGVQPTPDALALSLGDPPADDRITDPEGMARALAGFSPEAREVALASGSVRVLYSGPAGLTAAPSAWNVAETARGGSVSTSDGRTVSVTASDDERVRAWPKGALGVPRGFVARATVRPLAGASACGSAGFFFGLQDGRDDHVLVDAVGPDGKRWAYRAQGGWGPLGAVDLAPGTRAFTLEVAVSDGVGRMLVGGEPVTGADGSAEFAVVARPGGAVGLTANGCQDGTPARFAFSEVEILAIGERAPALTNTATVRSLGPGAAPEAAASLAPTPAPGASGAVGVAPAGAGPAGYVYTFRRGAGLWRVRLAGADEVWVQPPGAETWREAEPGEVAALLGTAPTSVVTQTALSDAEAAAALEALRRAAE